MTRLIFSRETVTALGLETGIAALSEDYDFRLGFDAGDGVTVHLQNLPGNTLCVECKGQEATISWDQSHRFCFFRALSLLIEHLSRGEASFCEEETVHFDLNGPMFDVSQGNAVINLPTMKRFLRRMAMMGLSLCMLYCEDSFTVPEEPYFGYMRSRYTYDDMKELDDYADNLGIEIVPCIQTLAHLRDVLKWDAFLDIREDMECLLPEEEKTYVFIRRLIEAASAPLRSRRIHIGMDEAWGLGRGTHLDRHGHVHASEIMQKHLARVMEITKSLGLYPMMWDDMFFRAFGAYYQPDLTFSQEYLDAMPKDIDLVYWDYVRDDPRIYKKLFRQHKQLGNILFAGGIWSWMGFGVSWARTFNTTNAALSACKQAGIREVMVTIWGDQGTECDVRMNLPGLQLYAEHGYAETVSEEKLRRRFEFCAKASYDDFLAVEAFDETPGVAHGNPNQENPSKYLLWQDPLCGLFDKNIEGLPLDAHYRTLATRMAKAAHGEYEDLFELYRLVAHCLALKSELGIHLHEAYRAGDRAALLELSEGVLPDLISRVRALRAQHFRCWRQNYKMLGWEVFDLRYGGLLIRLDTTAGALRDYLDGTRERIEELEEPQLLYNGKKGILGNVKYYGRIVSASRIAGEAPPKRPKTEHPVFP